MILFYIIIPLQLLVVIIKYQDELFSQFESKRKMDLSGGFTIQKKPPNENLSRELNGRIRFENQSRIQISGKSAEYLSYKNIDYNTSWIWFHLYEVEENLKSS